jgi:putative acetyltransferase
MLTITPADLDDPAVIDLVRYHQTTAREQTEPGSAHSFDISRLKAPDVMVWTIHDDGALVGIGALKDCGDGTGEVKSMHTLSTVRRRGVGRTMLAHIIATGRALGLHRLSLETGSWPYFAPSHALYRAHGFVECPAFEPYKPDPNSLFFTLDLQLT